MLPTLSSSSASSASPEDCLRAAVSFQKQKEQAIGIAARLTGKHRPASKSSRGVDRGYGTADSETECEDIIRAMNSATRRRARSQSSSKCTEHKDSIVERAKGDNPRSLSPIDESNQAVPVLTALETTAAQASSLESPQPHVLPTESTTPQPSAQNNSDTPNTSGAVMVLMSTTQATVVIIAALLVAALLGALTLWLTLAFEPFNHVIRFFTLMPEIKRGIVLQYARTRIGFYHRLQGCLEAIIDRLEQTRDRLVLAQRTLADGM